MPSTTATPAPVPTVPEAVCEPDVDVWSGACMDLAARCPEILAAALDGDSSPEIEPEVRRRYLRRCLEDPATKSTAASPPMGAAPATFSVRFATTTGDIVVACRRDWAPQGADRLYELVKQGFYDDVAFFRAVPGFVVQFGIHGDPAVAAKWRGANLPPDPVRASNVRGTLTFAQAGQPSGPGMTASSRTTQLFFNRIDNGRLDALGFAPVCEITSGLDVLDRIHDGYGEKAGRDQRRIQAGGNAYLRQTYPALDYITAARLMP